MFFNLFFCPQFADEVCPVLKLPGPHHHVSLSPSGLDVWFLGLSQKDFRETCQPPLQVDGLSRWGRCNHRIRWVCCWRVWKSSNVTCLFFRDGFASPLHELPPYHCGGVCVPRSLGQFNSAGSQPGPGWRARLSAVQEDLSAWRRGAAAPRHPLSWEKEV